MDSKFEAVIDLQAQPLTDAVKVAIAGLQALADELSKANSSLDQAAGGMDKSAAAADSVAGSTADAASAMKAEADAANASAAAHDKHAAAAKKDADASRQVAEASKKMREGLMVGASALRMGASIASATGSDNLAKALDLGGSILNGFAMRSMMGTPGMVIGGVEAAGKAIEWGVSAYNKAQDRATSIRQTRAKSGYDFEDMTTAVNKLKTYNDQLKLQASLDATILNLQREMKLLDLAPGSPENETTRNLLMDKIGYAMRAKNDSLTLTPQIMGSENAKLLEDFDKIRKEAIGNKAFELELINARSESDKIDVIERRMRQLRSEGEAKEAAARAAQKTATPAEIQKLLDEAAALYSSADSMEAQRADMGRGKGVNAPALAGPTVQVDAFWSRGLFLGGSAGGNASLEYTRRTATASENTAKNTERLALMPTGATATWGD